MILEIANIYPGNDEKTRDLFPEKKGNYMIHYLRIRHFLYVGLITICPLVWANDNVCYELREPGSELQAKLLVHKVDHVYLKEFFVPDGEAESLLAKELGFLKEKVIPSPESTAFVPLFIRRWMNHRKNIVVHYEIHYRNLEEKDLSNLEIPSPRFGYRYSRFQFKVSIASEVSKQEPLLLLLHFTSDEQNTTSRTRLPKTLDRSKVYELSEVAVENCQPFRVILSPFST